MRSNYENIVYRDIIMNSQNNSNAQNQPNAEKNKEVDNNDYYKSTDKTEKQENEKNPQNDKNYGRTTGLYSEKMLKKTLRQHFITIPQSEQDHQQLMENIQNVSKNLKYALVAQEEHATEGKHYHILLTGINPIGIGAIHKRIMMTPGNIKGSINYQKVSTIKAVETYCKKDGNWKEYGALATKKYNADTKDKINEDLNEIYNNDKTYEDNINEIREKQPAYYTQYANNIEKHLKKKEEKVYKKWTPPTYDTKNTILKPYQAKIWKLINEPPKNRQIIWVCGKPNTGKSFMFNYINDNYDWGIYNAGSTASQDNAIYGYEEEGAIAWDIPKSYDFKNYGDALASTIEKFSDFGQQLTSRKYQGKKVRALGHVIVFSNRKVLSQLKHRDVIEINVSDDESIKEKLEKWNLKIKFNPNRKQGQSETIWEHTTPQPGEEPIRRYYYNKEDLPEEIAEDIYGQTDQQKYDIAQYKMKVKQQQNDMK
jgi:hypothetical protein